MNISLDTSILVNYVLKQLQNFIPDTDSNIIKELKIILPIALERLEFCFSRINLPYFRDNNGNTNFSHLHTDQYCMFLYFLSNEAYKNDMRELYIRLSILNKSLNSIDLFGHIEMPNIFLLVHPIGTIIGRASFKNYLTIYQGVTIGGIHKDEKIFYPKFEEHINIFAHSKILGKCYIEKNVTFGANTFIINKTIKKNSIVTGQYPNNSISLKDQQWNLFSF